MTNRIVTTGLAIMAMMFCAVATAQRATEVYIPIGESPGVSGDESVIGTITDIDYEDGRHRMAVAVGGVIRTVTMTPDTRYYIDKSGEKTSSVTGSVEDCREGRRIEVYVDRNGNAIWIKIVAN